MSGESARAPDQRPTVADGKPEGGMKSEAGRSDYWRMQHESAIGALADLIAENTANVETAREALDSLDLLCQDDERNGSNIRAHEVRAAVADLRALHQRPETRTNGDRP